MKRLLLFFRNLTTWTFLCLLGIYRLVVSPLLGMNCRHLPTCSEYAKDAVIAFGPLRGFFYTLKRILRCHPWAQPMVDPVVPIFDWERTRKSQECQKSRVR